MKYHLLQDRLLYHITKNIDENFRKAVSTFKANLKKQGDKSEDEQNEMARKEEQSKAIDYATKKKE